MKASKINITATLKNLKDNGFDISFHYAGHVLCIQREIIFDFCVMKKIEHLIINR